MDDFEKPDTMLRSDNFAIINENTVNHAGTHFPTKGSEK
jgi:hypothetical protein